MCLDILWRLRIRFQFLAESCHEYTQRRDIVIPASAPDILSDKCMGQYFAHIFGKQAEELIFNRCQMKRLVFKIKATAGLINPEFAVDEYRTCGQHFSGHIG